MSLLPRTHAAKAQRGDCLKLFKSLPDASIDLVYLDPPFCSQKIHRLSPRDRSREFSFADVWSTQQHYTKFLYPRVQECYRVLHPDGSLFFHCDRNAVHVVRAMLDERFGSEHFRAEIIWHYRRWSNSRRGLLPSHQTILYYTKSSRFTFNPTWTDYSPATNIDQILQRRGRDPAKKSTYQRDAQGQVITSGAKRGVPLGDVWDIPYLNPKAKERTGYPTQKPLLLLERIIRLASNEGDQVLDPFCGSGTTLVAAKLLGRKSLGFDSSADAIALTKRRLKAAVRSRSRLLELGRDTYHNADKSSLAMLQGLELVPVQRNRGIDAILKQPYRGGPVPIRVQRQGETIAETAERLAKAAANKGAKIMFAVRIDSFDIPATGSLPPRVVVVDSTATEIASFLKRR